MRMLSARIRGFFLNLIFGKKIFINTAKISQRNQQKEKQATTKPSIKKRNTCKARRQPETKGARESQQKQLNS